VTQNPTFTLAALVPELIAAPDQEAKNAVYDRLYPLLVPFIQRRLSRVPDLRDDVLQDSLVRIWQSLSRLKATPENLNGYLHKVVVNAGNAAIKELCCRPETGIPEGYDPPAPGPVLWEQLVWHERQAALEGFLRTLKREHTHIALLHWSVGMKKVEIAAHMGISESTVNTTVSRVERKIIRHFRRLGVFDAANDTPPE